MRSRRDVLKVALSTGGWLAAAALGCHKRRATQVAAPPRYWVMILLSGGHDTLYTTDPKTAAEVDSIVTLPTDNRSVTVGDLRLGAQFAGLSKWASKLSTLNGVQVHTANHDTGQKQFLHLKTNIGDNMPSALDIIAARREGQPLGVTYLNLSARVMHSPAYFGTADRFYFGEGDVFSRVSDAQPGELAALAKAMRTQATALGRAGATMQAAQTAVYMRETAEFFERVSSIPPLVPEQRSVDYVAQSMSETLERTLWLIENDLTCGVVLDLGLLGWDTHIRNESKQVEMNGNFASYFDDFMAELHARKNGHGVLGERTVVVVGSELGRFPRQNDMLGKDHLPQTSFLFSGPGIRAGRTFGVTGPRMEGLPIDYRDGHPAAAGRVPLLDDVGATLLRLGGLDPERYGYAGRACEFLLDRTS